MVAKKKHKEHLDKISVLFADSKKITKALADGVRAALLKHKQMGKPIVVWENGKAVWIPPEKIVINTKHAGSRKNNK